MEKETMGTVISVTKQWWLKVNRKPARAHAMDGAAFPHTIKVKYTIDGKDYICRKWIGAGNKVPDKGTTIKVTILNIILFVPLGFFLPLLYKKYGHIGSVALVSFLLSLSIEIVQMFGRGATDINDLITNTVGACLGFFIYQLLSKLVSKELCRKFQSYNINEGTELLFFIIYSFVIMVTIQPILILYYCFCR